MPQYKRRFHHIIPNAPRVKIMKVGEDTQIIALAKVVDEEDAVDEEGANTGKQG